MNVTAKLELETTGRHINWTFQPLFNVNITFSFLVSHRENRSLNQSLK